MIAVPRINRVLPSSVALASSHKCKYDHHVAPICQLRHPSSCVCCTAVQQQCVWGGSNAVTSPVVCQHVCEPRARKRRGRSRKPLQGRIASFIVQRWHTLHTSSDLRFFYYKAFGRVARFRSPSIYPRGGVQRESY